MVSNISFDGQQPDPDMQPGQYLMVAVKDTGCGMDEDVQQRIFEPFFTTKEQGQGNGLGLAVAYGIVKGYNGAITVSSKAGEGSVFRVFLPTVDAAQEAEGEEERRSVIAGHERSPLFVDDEPALGEVAEEGCFPVWATRSPRGRTPWRPWRLSLRIRTAMIWW